MGKRLILKGADFSENGFPVHNYQWVNWYDEFEGADASSSSNKLYIVQSEITRLGLSGVTVKCMYLYAASNGTIDIGEATPGETPTYSKEHTYAVNHGLNLIELEEPITLDGSNSIYINGRGVYTYTTKVGDDTTKGWLFTNAGIDGGTSRIPIAFGTF